MWIVVGVVHISISRGHMTYDNPVCFTLAVLPKHYMVICACLRFIIDSCVIVLNVKIFNNYRSLKTRISVIVSKENSKSCSVTQRETSFIECESTIVCSDPRGEDEQEPSCSSRGMQHSASLPVLFPILDSSSLPVISPMVVNRETIPQASSASSNTLSIPQERNRSFKLHRASSHNYSSEMVSGLRFKYINNSECPKTHGDRKDDSTTHSNDVHVLPKIYSPLQNITARLKQPSFDQISIEEGHCRDVKGFTNQQAKSNYMRVSQQTITLIIISLLTFTLNLPFFVYICYVASAYEDKSVSTAMTRFPGPLLSIISLMNVAGMPFIYAWRFIHWAEMLIKLRRLCSCLKQQEAP